MKQERQVARGALVNQRLSAIATRWPLLLLRLNEIRARQNVSGTTFNADVQGEMNVWDVSFAHFPSMPPLGKKEKTNPKK
jgi:hypothetical protein